MAATKVVAGAAPTVDLDATVDMRAVLADKNRPPVADEDAAAMAPLMDLSLEPITAEFEAYKAEHGAIKSDVSGEVPDTLPTPSASTSLSAERPLDLELPQTPGPELKAAFRSAQARDNTSSRDRSTAKAVYAAGGHQASNAVIVKLGVIVGSVLVLFLIAFGVYYSYMKPEVHRMPSPRVAEQVIPHASPALPVALLPVASPVPELPVELPAESAVESPKLIDEPPSTTSALPIPTLQDLPKLLPDALATGRGVAARAPRSIVARSNIGQRKVNQRKVNQRNVKISQGELRIQRSTHVDPTVAALRKAYAAVQRGAWDVAGDLYKGVLARNPAQRDALLGLAAVRLAEGSPLSAARIYHQVIELDPGDSVAMAALVQLEDGQGNYGVSQLKLMLDQQPAAAHLHFALGQAHARARRWSDAQAAYFQAFAGSSEDPDYAYNLAVSLDHLGKYRAALSFYRKALALADHRPIHFSAVQAAQRVSALKTQVIGP